MWVRIPPHWPALKRKGVIKVPRKRIVSRTIKTTQGEALAVDKETRELESVPFVLSGHYENPDKMIEALNQRNDGYVYTIIQAYHFESEKYVMPEDDFIAHSEIERE